MSASFQLYYCNSCKRGTRVSVTGLRFWEYPPPPTCCGQPMKWRMSVFGYEEPAPRFGSAPAIDFNQTRGRIAPIGDGIAVNSLHDIRRIERESEQRARNGEGQPLVFRKYAQDRGNLHTSTLGENPSHKPRLTDSRGRQKISIRPVDESTANADVLGPGIVNDGDSGFPEG
jgi:hypothetical protein